MKQYSLAVLGTEATTAIYKLLGVEAVVVSDNDDLQKSLETLVKATQNDGQTPKYAVVFVDDLLHAELSDDFLERLTKRPLPAVVPVPTPASSTGKKSYGVSRLRRLVERAVGSDILS